MGTFWNFGCLTNESNMTFFVLNSETALKSAVQFLVVLLSAVGDGAFLLEKHDESEE